MKALILGQSKNEKGELTLKIATTDFLVPDHQAEYDLALQLVSFLVENATPEEVTELFAPAGKNGQSDSEYVTITNSENQTISDSEYVTIKDSDKRTIEDSENTTISFSEKQTHPLIKKFRFSHDIKYLKFKYLSLEILKNLILNLMMN